MAKCSEQRGGIHGNPGNGNHPKAATNQHRHTEKLIGDTYQEDYLPEKINTSETTGRLMGREEWERESATIRKKAQLICYDQQAKQTKH